MNKYLFSDLAEVMARWYVFFFLNFYGLGKMAGMQFYRRGELPEAVAMTPLGEASAFDLGWTFMGYSFGYILFVGVSQVVGAWLLLWPRTKLLGVGILLPIMLNIIVFDIIFLETKGAIANASIYLLLLLYVLYHNRQQVETAFNALTTGRQNPVLSQGKRLRVLVYIALLAAGLFAVDQTLVTFIGH